MLEKGEKRARVKINARAGGVVMRCPLRFLEGCLQLEGRLDFSACMSVKCFQCFCAPFFRWLGLLRCLKSSVFLFQAQLPTITC